MTDNRTGVPLITDVLDVLDRHGYTRSDNAHTVRAILLISDLAQIYEGSQDYPFGPYFNEIPPRTERPAPEPAGQETVRMAACEVKTVLVALDIAADYQRDRAELCADCTTQSCPACESHLRDAKAYGRLNTQLTQAAQAALAEAARHPEPSPAADREAGQ